jgi:hypothetical protein
MCRLSYPTLSRSLLLISGLGRCILQARATVSMQPLAAHPLSVRFSPLSGRDVARTSRQAPLIISHATSQTPVPQRLSCFFPRPDDPWHHGNASTCQNPADTCVSVGEVAPRKADLLSVCLLPAKHTDTLRFLLRSASCARWTPASASARSPSRTTGAAAPRRGSWRGWPGKGSVCLVAGCSWEGGGLICV